MKAIVLAGVLALTPLAHADVVQRVWWNPGLTQHGGTDPFVGQSTDDALAMAGNLSQVGLVRTGDTIGAISFTNVPSSFDENYYVEFSVIPGAGMALDVHDLILQAGNNGTPMPLDRIALRTEVDGFTSSVVAQAGPSGLQGNTGRPVLFDLEALPELTQETHFRLYAWGINGPFGIIGSIATSGYGMWFGNVDAHTVPAPASAALLGVGALVATRRRR